MTEVTKEMMPSYMFRHFNKAINKKRKSAAYLVERGYEFYVCEDIHSEIRGGTRYDGSSIITFKGIRIRMSTTRPYRECRLSCYRHDNESSIKFTVPPVPPPAPDLPTRDSSRKQYSSEPNRLWQSILSFIDWLNRLAGAEKLKEKTNGEQMLTLGELFEGYEDIPEDMVTFREDRERGTVHYKPPTPPQPPYPPTRDITRM